MTQQVETTTVTSMPRIGDPAPHFEAVTTQGNISFPEDYKGKWIIFSVTRQILHPCALRSL